MVPIDALITLLMCLDSFSICKSLSLIPACVYLNMYTHFPPLPYSYTFNAIFICMFCVLFYIYNHFFSYKFNRHVCHGAYWYTHNLVHIRILWFLLHFHFCNSCVCVRQLVYALPSSIFILISCHIHMDIFWDCCVMTPYILYQWRIHVKNWKINRDLTNIKINYNSKLYPSHKQWNVRIPKLIYYYAFVWCSIPHLFVNLQMRMSTSLQHSCVRGLLQECHLIQSGASGLPYYCTPLVCISVVIELLAVWWHNKPKTKKNQRMRMSTSKQHSTNIHVSEVHCRSAVQFSQALPGFLVVNKEARKRLTGEHTLPVCISVHYLCASLL